MAARVQEYTLPYKETARCALGCGGRRGALRSRVCVVVGCAAQWDMLHGEVRCMVAKKFLLGPGGRDIVDSIVFSPFLKEEINET